ncbi:MAG: hypothetical protein H0T96_01325 [Thermoleophilaceae bacterium]|jgi:hypothetical protein|nr:hypothetical protein [Thermoleophilaceae bacterium]MDQ3319745.1 hypothetical protein [Actinomycetota bacterium]MDQ3356535.1 hypothetical protein [Actinomycetota bacterium]
MEMLRPGSIAHADWGVSGAKRAVAAAEFEGDRYLAHAPQVVASEGPLVERMGVGSTARGALLGFDFPIGLPQAFGSRVDCSVFSDWFRGLDPASEFFQVAKTVEDASVARPFFPVNIRTKSPGIKERWRSALGLTKEELFRACEFGHGDRRTASEMFWTLGPAAVGKATLNGWSTAIRPALSETHRSYAIWPFDGTLADLLAANDAVIVETYPAEAYGLLGLRMGSPGTSKTSQASRRAEAPRLLQWCAEHHVEPDQQLQQEIEDGFGPSKGGEDPFDAVAGLFGMMATLSLGGEPPLPADDAVRDIEGWMFGRRPDQEGRKGAK